jgi:uncharacterized protein (TIGR02271 family)
MNERTLTALYQTREDAEAACERLRAAGFGQKVNIHEQGGEDRAGSSHDGGGFMEKLREFFGGHEDAHTYAEGVRRGHYLLTVRVEEMAAERAAQILDATNAVDIDRTEQTWRAEGWTSPGAKAPADTTQRATAPPPATERRDGREEVIPLAEERLRVGKREVERGGVKVRTYVVETPVHEQVNLREEHVSVERRPVDRPVGASDQVFQERSQQFTETAEEAVVAKEAVVREEVVVRRDATERRQDIDETVRRTEVDVDKTAGRDQREADKPTPPRRG